MSKSELNNAYKNLERKNNKITVLLQNDYLKHSVSTCFKMLFAFLYVTNNTQERTILISDNTHVKLNSFGKKYLIKIHLTSEKTKTRS